MIGLIGAMKMEIEGLVDKLVNEKQEMVSGICFHSGEISGTQCVIAQCGPGKVNAAICTEAMLLRYAPSAIINLGVAGGIGPDIRIGDAVIATSVVQHDMDTTALGDAKGFISGLGRILIHTDEKLTRKLCIPHKSIWELSQQATNLLPKMMSCVRFVRRSMPMLVKWRVEVSAMSVPPTVYRLQCSVRFPTMQTTMQTWIFQRLQ